jgi:hypothetical protein
MNTKFSKTHADFVKKFGNKNYSYCEPALKKSMHTAAAKYLRALAEALGFSREACDVRSNMGGVAGSGEITLHTDTLYVQLHESIFGHAALCLMVRGCESRKDYTGHRNQFVQLTAAPEAILRECKAAARKTATA